MALHIETFDNARGGNTLYKALTHPAAARLARSLLAELARCRARAVFVAAFDAERMLAQIRAFLPDGAKVFSLDAMRIPADRLTNRRSYLDPLNFATNFAFFRDAAGLHTQLVTVNYWSGYGAGQINCCLTLFAGDG